MMPLSTVRSEKPLFQLYVQRSLKISYIEKNVSQNATELLLSLLSAHVARDVVFCVSFVYLECTDGKIAGHQLPKLEFIIFIQSEQSKLSPQYSSNLQKE